MERGMVWKKQTSSGAAGKRSPPPPPARVVRRGRGREGGGRGEDLRAHRRQRRRGRPLRAPPRRRLPPRLRAGLARHVPGGGGDEDEPFEGPGRWPKPVVARRLALRVLQSFCAAHARELAPRRGGGLLSWFASLAGAVGNPLFCVELQRTVEGRDLHLPLASRHASDSSTLVGDRDG